MGLQKGYLIDIAITCKHQILALIVFCFDALRRFVVLLYLFVSICFECVSNIFHVDT